MKILVDIATIKHGIIAADGYINRCQCGHKWTMTAIVDGHDEYGEPTQTLFCDQVADFCPSCGRRLTP